VSDESTLRADADEMARKIVPRGDRVFCRALRENRRIGSIYLPDNANKSLDLVVSQVLSRGPDVKCKPWELAPGDFVLHVRVAGTRYDGILGSLGRHSDERDTDYLFLYEKDCLAVVDPAAVTELVGNAQLSEGKTGEWRQ
jgi:co-chaperonin GroES (HSP10)